MKVRLYAGNINLIRKDEKYVEIEKNDFLGNKTVKTLFSNPNVYSPLGYLASIMF